VLLDITATSDSRQTAVELAAKVAQGVFIPFTIGGGIRSADDAQAVLDAGADKVAVNSAAVANPQLISDLAERFGSQCVVLAIDAARRSDQPGWEVYTAGGRNETGVEAVEWAARGCELGAGEILLTSMDRDGTRDGYDLALLSAVCDAVPVPVIASGGAGTPEHLARALESGADAALLASILHDGETSVGEIKAELIELGIDVRP
jgi:cyclase